jgi:hypothetical protein
MVSTTDKVVHKTTKIPGPSLKPLSQRVMSMNASILVDSVGPPSAEVCRTAASFP